MAEKTITIADKVTLDEVKSLLEDRKYGLEAIKSAITAGGEPKRYLPLIATMTSDTSEQGRASATSSLSTDNKPYCAFNNAQANFSTMGGGWLANRSDLTPILTFMFNQPQELDRIWIETANPAPDTSKIVFIEGTVDGRTWENILLERDNVSLVFSQNKYDNHYISLNRQEYLGFRIRGSEKFYDSSVTYACIFSRVQIYKEIAVSGVAAEVYYDNVLNLLKADNVQDAIDELAENKVSVEETADNYVISDPSGDTFVIAKSALQGTASVTQKSTKVYNIKDEKNDVDFDVYTKEEVDSKINSKGLGVVGTGRNSAIFNDYSENTASGDYSLAEGLFTVASGKTAHAEGTNNKATNEGAHSEGKNNQSTGKYSHSEGNYTVAAGESSHAEGVSNQATGKGSHAEGSGTAANGDYSHTSGIGTIAPGQGQAAFGKYNLDRESLFSIGNGSSTQRSDIMRVTNEGIFFFAPIYKYNREIEGGRAVQTSYDNFSSGASATNVQDALDEVFSSVSNGKKLIAEAITDKGVETSSTDTFRQMAENISQISGGGGGGSIYNTLFMDDEVSAHQSTAEDSGFTNTVSNKKLNNIIKTINWHQYFNGTGATIDVDSDTGVIHIVSPDTSKVGIVGFSFKNDDTRPMSYLFEYNVISKVSSSGCGVSHLVGSANDTTNWRTFYDIYNEEYRSNLPVGTTMYSKPLSVINKSGNKNYFNLWCGGCEVYIKAVYQID